MNILIKASEKAALDPKVVNDVYYSLIRAMIEELRTNGKVRLPDLGEFRVIEYKARTIGDINNGGVKKQVPAVPVLKFRICTKLREYIKTIKQ